MGRFWVKDVFISYKAEEIEEASWVKSVLESNGISCWMAPACIPGGSSYAVEIPQAIRGAKVFVLILSSKAQTSRWISREVDLAINEGKTVLPFMLENCALKDDFNFYLTNVQRYAAYENKLAAAERMINEIKALIGVKENTVSPNNTVGVTNNVNINLMQPNVAEPPRRVQQPVIYAHQNVKPLNKTAYDVACALSLCFGIIAMMLFGMLLVPNIVAIILSIVGLDRINKKGLRGKGLAITGQVLGLASTVIGLGYWFAGAGLVVSIIIMTISLILFVKKYKSISAQ